MNIQEYLKQQELGDHFFEYVKQEINKICFGQYSLERWEDMVTFLYTNRQTTLPWQEIVKAQHMANTQDSQAIQHKKERHKETVKESIKITSDLCETFLESLEQMEDPSMYAIALLKSRELHQRLKAANPKQTYHLKDVIQVAVNYVNKDPEAFHLLCKAECDQYLSIRTVEKLQKSTYQQEAFTYCMNEFLSFEQSDPSLNHAKLDQTVAKKTLLRTAQTLSYHFGELSQTKGGMKDEPKKIKHQNFAL